MKKLVLTVVVFLGLPASLLAMDDPNSWQRPQRPSQSGRPPRPRPTAVNYGAAPLDPITTDNNTPAYIPQPPQVTNPMHIITTTPTPAPTQTTAIAQQSISAKERERLGKIKKDLDKIEELLKEMGIDLALTAVSAVSLDPITVAFTGTGALIHIPKLAYYYGNMQKHIFYLSSSKTSPEAKARLKELTPRLQAVARVIAKGPEKLQKLIKKFSKEESKEAK
ncbi:MAG: hypothetical protein AMXMBFR12_00380 [Candidatus Babeliales bacterium]